MHDEQHPLEFHPATLVAAIQTALNGLPMLRIGVYSHGRERHQPQCDFDHVPKNISVNADGAATPTVSFNGAGLTLTGASPR